MFLYHTIMYSKCNTWSLLVFIYNWAAQMLEAVSCFLLWPFLLSVLFVSQLLHYLLLWWLSKVRKIIELFKCLSIHCDVNIAVVSSHSHRLSHYSSVISQSDCYTTVQWQVSQIQIQQYNGQLTCLTVQSSDQCIRLTHYSTDISQSDTDTPVQWPVSQALTL